MRDFAVRDALLYIVANNPGTEQITFGRSIGAEAIALDSLTPAYLNVDPSLVFDLDLRSIEIVRKLKSALPRHGGGCRIFLVDPHSRVAAVHARVLGADAVLPVSASADDIDAAMRAHFGIRPGNGSSDVAVRQSIDSGVNAMNDSFNALADDLAFSVAGVGAASGLIADAIKDVGVQEWLTTVKGYHVGTYQHCMLVTGVASAFGNGAGMARQDVIKLTVAGMLHDIGKAAIPIEILDKPTALSDDEMAIMRTHAVIGNAYLTRRGDLSADILSSVRSHHELLDGSGYPDGLRAEQIGDLTRILTICDIYAALIERRSYKEPRSPAQAMIILEGMAGSGKLETSLVREFGRIMLANQAG